MALNRHTLLVPTDVIAAHLSDPAWVIVDCRFDLANPGAGEEQYEAAHIPGAVYAHLERDLSGVPSGRNGRHPLPPVEVLSARFGSWGIGPEVQVVAYDQGAGAFASRLWWLLRALGHETVAVLDGGFEKWRREGRPVGAGREIAAGRVFQPRLARDRWVEAADVETLVASASARLIDARAAERYRGDIEPLDPVAGHIPGARNRPYLENLAPDGTFLAPAILRRQFGDVLGGVEPNQAVVYCGSGVTACHNLLAMEIAGLEGARLYPGSWSEWCSDPARPVERTPAPPPEHD